MRKAVAAALTSAGCGSTLASTSATGHWICKHVGGREAGSAC